MIQFDVIRGHRLILWATRLGFDPTFVATLDKTGFNYVQQAEKLDENQITLIVLSKVKDSDIPVPIIFNVPEETKRSLVETIQVKSLSAHDG